MLCHFVFRLNGSASRDREGLKFPRRRACGTRSLGWLGTYDVLSAVVVVVVPAGVRLVDVLGRRLVVGRMPGDVVLLPRFGRGDVGGRLLRRLLILILDVLRLLLRVLTVLLLLILILHFSSPLEVGPLVAPFELDIREHRPVCRTMSTPFLDIIERLRVGAGCGSVWMSRLSSERKEGGALTETETETKNEPDETIGRLSRCLKTLCSEAALKILDGLKNGPHSVGELALLAEISPQAASNHLKALWGAGLVSRSRQGQRVVYSLDREALKRIADSLA